MTVNRRTGAASCQSPDSASRPGLAISHRVQKLLLVDEQPILRDGFAHLINLESDLQVCGQADNAHAALTFIGVQRPDLVIVDIDLKGSNGIELIKRIKAFDPGLPVLVLSVQDEALFAERALRAGARGYVMKQAPAEDVMTAIRQVLRGGRYLSRNMQERILENLSDSAPRGPIPSVEHLSDRELEVFQLLGSGSGTREIAEQLHLSIKTVETYRAHIKKKLKLRNATELLRMAVQRITE
jgi:DNA-binding NarL/FixJ family response regulator